MGSGQREVESFLQEIGLESCVQAVVHNGFYTSMEALRGATYEELVDSGVRPVHAKLIISNLGSKGGGPLPPRQGDASSNADDVLHFLRSVGLENCGSELAEAGYHTLDALCEATMQELLAAGLKPVHARLIVSNLDTASTAGINMTPAAQRLNTLEAEDESSLLGAPKRKRPKRVRIVCVAMLLLVAVIVVTHALGGAGEPPQPEGGKHHGGAHKGKGGGEHHGGGGASKGGGAKLAKPPM